MAMDLSHLYRPGKDLGPRVQVEIAPGRKGMDLESNSMKRGGEVATMLLSSYKALGPSFGRVVGGDVDVETLEEMNRQAPVYAALAPNADASMQDVVIADLRQQLLVKDQESRDLNHDYELLVKDLERAGEEIQSLQAKLAEHEASLSEAAIEVQQEPQEHQGNTATEQKVGEKHESKKSPAAGRKPRV